MNYTKGKIDEIMESIMIEDFPPELDALAHIVRISSVVVKTIRERGNLVTGSGDVYVSLQTDSDRETAEEDLYNISFPFVYTLFLNSEKEIVKKEIEVNTDKFYK